MQAINKNNRIIAMRAEKKTRINAMRAARQEKDKQTVGEILLPWDE